MISIIHHGKRMAVCGFPTHPDPGSCTCTRTLYRQAREVVSALREFAVEDQFDEDRVRLALVKALIRAGGALSERDRELAFLRRCEREGRDCRGIKTFKEDCDCKFIIDVCTDGKNEWPQDCDDHVEIDLTKRTVSVHAWTYWTEEEWKEYESEYRRDFPRAVKCPFDPREPLPWDSLPYMMGFLEGVETMRPDEERQGSGWVFLGPKGERFGIRSMWLGGRSALVRECEAKDVKGDLAKPRIAYEHVVDAARMLNRDWLERNKGCEEVLRTIGRAFIPMTRNVSHFLRAYICERCPVMKKKDADFFTNCILNCKATTADQYLSWAADELEKFMHNPSPQLSDD